MTSKEKKLLKIEKKLKKQVDASISCSQIQDSILLKGRVDSWDKVVCAGYIAAKSSFREVVNDIFFDDKNQKIQNKIIRNEQVSKSDDVQTSTCDVLIIGAGIIGASIARELSKYDLYTILVDKAYDVAVHTSSRNDGMIHPGIAAPTKSLKCKMNIRGNALYSRISEELDVPIRWCGSTILFRSHSSKLLKPFFKYKAKKIGMTGLKFLDRKAVYAHEPNLTPGVIWGVLCERSGVTSPYRMTVAYAENAIHNGVKLVLNCEVTAMTMQSNGITCVHTTQGDINPKLVINAAGVYADLIAEMANDRYFTIHPRKGEVVLFDKKKSNLVNGILGFIGDRSSKNTKGGGIIKTYEGNILVGPNAIETQERENYETDIKTIKELLEQKLPQIKGLTKEDDITYFTGIRAATYKEDFIIEASNQVNNLIHVAGIQSPGFASAPAIAERVESLVLTKTEAIFKRKIKVKPEWNPIRRSIPNVAEMPYEVRQALIEKRPEYGEIICRCEEISKGEIVDALQSLIPVETIDGIKRRVRAGMGRCQGGFCLPLVMDIIHEVKGIPIDEITKKSGESRIVIHKTKQ